MQTTQSTSAMCVFRSPKISQKLMAAFAKDQMSD